jgi:hypothetical protein
MVKVAFFKTSSKYADWVDKLIAWWTKGRYSHVELIIDNEQYSSFIKEGVRKKPHYFDNDAWDYLSIEGVSETRIKEFFKQTKGRNYDWAGILGFILPLADAEKKYFCSEWVAKALMIGGYSNLYKYKESNISPQRLYDILTHRK